MQAFQKPAGFLEIVAQVAVVGAAVGALDETRVVAVDAQAWRRIGIELYDPAAFLLADEYIGYHVLRIVIADLFAGEGVEGLHQLQDFPQVIFWQFHAPHDLREIAIT